MPPLNALDTAWADRSSSEILVPKAKCFFVAEGENTERWYLESLAIRLRKEGVPELLELRPVERTAEELHQSNPKKLVEHAKAIQDDEDGLFGFDKDTDTVVILFDADIYRGDEEPYFEDLAAIRNLQAIPAVTNPSFELFLLLHSENAVEEIIEPHETEILQNEHVSKSKRFLEKLISEKFGMNPKTNYLIGDVSKYFDRAVEAEKSLNNDPDKAIGVLTSNIGCVITNLIEKGRQKPSLVDPVN